jgi:hypothetical protein
LAKPGTAWHCCLGFFSVATRLPPEFRLRSADAIRLLEEEVFGRLTIHDLPALDEAAHVTCRVFHLDVEVGLQTGLANRTQKVGLYIT